MTRAARLVLAAALIGSAGARASQLAAQDAKADIRTLHVSRPLTATQSMHVNVKYGAGTLTLKPATRPVLYDVRMSYQAGESTPQASFDPATHSLDVGMKDGTFHNVNFDSTGYLQVALAPGVPLDLSLKIGAAQATLNLGGLAVHSLVLKGGATQTTVTFDSANLIPMQSMTMEVGAAQFEAHGLANARARNITVGGVAGQIELWFDGTWTSDVTLNSKIALGEMKIHVPADVRVVPRTRAIFGAVSDGTDENPSHGKASSTGSDASDSSDMDMSDSSDDADDSDSSASASVAAKGKAAAQARLEAAKARDEAAKARAEAAQEKADAQQAQTEVAPRHTLYITGSATLGSLEILHDPPAAGSH
jgi:hypothetical protein